MTAATHTEGRLDHAVGSLSRGLARRVTRRSAVSRLGRYGAALSLGAAGAALLDDTAWAAATSSCCQGCYGTCPKYDSRWCDDGGQCPSTTCQCGAWWSGCYCSNGQKWMYGDCCGDCGCGTDCFESSSYDCSVGPCPTAGGNGSPCPSCCFQFAHVSSVRQCGDCTSCSCPWYIRCRRAFCA